jgi:N-acetylglucosaminyldiphosphoundecaprenol N-acetyl-beta-D-mannosaminyltransferase
MIRSLSMLGRPVGCCRLCGATTGQERIGREPMANLGQWLIRCHECETSYLDPDLTAKGLEKFYQTDYRRLYPYEVCAHPDEAFLLAIRAREIGLRRARALASIAPRGGRVLEIGSGHGGFLGAMYRLRPDLTFIAVEPDERHRTLALDSAPIHFIGFTDLASLGPFDLIAMFHVLEHLVDPLDRLKRLASVMNPDGRLVVEVPDNDPRNLTWQDIHPAHVTYFSRTSLIGLCRAAGLDSVTPQSLQASLPACLWVECAHVPKAGSPLDATCQTSAVPRPMPSRRISAAQRVGQIIARCLPLEWRGALSRWRHIPGLDNALAEREGRRFRFGIGFDPVRMVDVLQRAEAAMDGRQSYRVADVNVAKLVGMQVDPDFRMRVLTADSIIADGIGVVWGLRLLGLPIPERVAGIDLLDQVMGLCARRGFRPFLLGAKKDVLDRAVASLRARYPSLHLAGSHDGYFQPSESGRIAELLSSSGADCLVVALPFPRQDIFLAEIHAISGIPFVFGVGGSLDVLAGDRRRAPRWMQRGGLEWLFRMIQEPRRLGWRYAVTNTRFGLLLMVHWLAWRLFGRL